MNRYEELNNYFKTEYGISYNSFKYSTDRINQNRKINIDFFDDNTLLNCYFKSETGMSYKEFMKIDCVEKKIPLKREKTLKKK